MYTNTFTKLTELAKYIYVDLPVSILLAHRLTTQHTNTQPINQRSFNKHAHKGKKQQTAGTRRNKHAAPPRTLYILQYNPFFKTRTTHNGHKNKDTQLIFVSLQHFQKQKN